MTHYQFRQPPNKKHKHPKQQFWGCIVVALLTLGLFPDASATTWQEAIEKSGQNLASVLKKQAAQTKTKKTLTVAINTFQAGAEQGVACEPLSGQLTAHFRQTLTQLKNQFDLPFVVVRENDPNRVDVVVIGKWRQIDAQQVALGIDVGDVKNALFPDLGIANTTFALNSLADTAKQCVFAVDPVLRWQHAKRKLFVYDSPNPLAKTIGTINKGQTIWVLARIRDSRWAVVNQKDENLPKWQQLGFVHQLFGKPPPTTIDTMDALARSIGAQLDNNLKHGRDRSVYVRQPIIAGLMKNTKLEDYLTHWLQTAVGHADLLTVKDPTVELKGLSKNKLVTRAFNRKSKLKKQSLTGRLVQADTDLLSNVYADKQQLELQVRLINDENTQVSTAVAKIALKLLPAHIISRPEEAIKHTAIADAGLTLKHLQLEVATNRGRQRAVYHRDEEMQLVIKTNQLVYLYLFNITPQGEVVVLFPLTDKEANQIQAHQPVIIPDDILADQFVATPPFGKDILWLVAVESRLPLEINKWQALNAEQLKIHFRTVAVQRNQAYADREVVLETEP